jgi:hypothetical protein
MPSYTEEDVTNALNALVNGEYKSIHRAALVFQIPYSTLRNRVQKPKSRKESHVSQQLLTPIEESTLENWVYRAAKLGAPITLQLVKILASEIQSKRSSNYEENKFSPISDRWVDRFRTRHPRIKTCFSRTIDTARSIALDFSTIKSYFDNLGEVLREHKYPPSAIYNVDETGFSIGSSRKSVVLLDRLNQHREKKQPGRQEWITCLECVSASGVTLPPCLIFKGENLNSGWIPDEALADWKFITSKKGWTSDLIGFEWLKTHFQPFVSQTSNSRHLLIIDGHSSHVTARFIAYCITSKIDLFLLPPHSSHKTQPLDLSIFGPLKTAINLEVDRIFRHSTTRLPRVEWTSAYIKARARCFKPSSIESGFRKAGIYPFYPEILLSTLTPPPRTPSPENQVPSHVSDASRILRARGSPCTPKALNLRQISDLVQNDEDIPTLARDLIRDLIDFAEDRDTDAILARRELREKDVLLNTRKTRKTGKRVALKGKYLLIKEDILKVVQDLEEGTKKKKTKKGRKKTKYILISSEEEEEESIDELA